MNSPNQDLAEKAAKGLMPLQKSSIEPSPQPVSVPQHLSSFAVGVGYASLTGFFYHVSPEFCSMLEKDKAELIDHSLTQLLYPDQYRRGQGMLDDFLESPEDNSFTCEYVGDMGKLYLTVTRILGATALPTALLVYVWRCGMGSRVGEMQFDFCHHLVNADEYLLADWGYPNRKAVMGKRIDTFFSNIEKVESAIHHAGPKRWCDLLTAQYPDGHTCPKEVIVEVLFSRKRRILGCLILCCFELPSYIAGS